MNTIYITGNEYGGWASRIFVNNKEWYMCGYVENSTKENTILIGVKESVEWMGEDEYTVYTEKYKDLVTMANNEWKLNECKKHAGKYQTRSLV